MEKCTDAFTTKSEVKNKKLEVSFSGGNITSHARLLLLQKLDSKLRLIKQASCLLGKG